jgi:hypothetical protein
MAMPSRNYGIPPEGNISMHAEKQRYHQASVGNGIELLVSRVNSKKEIQ